MLWTQLATRRQPLERDSPSARPLLSHSLSMAHLSLASRFKKETKKEIIFSANLTSTLFIFPYWAKLPAGTSLHVEILDPLTFAFLLIGSSLPYWFSAMTMKSVGKAAKLMIRKVELQLKQNPDLLNPNTKVVRKGFFFAL